METTDSKRDQIKKVQALVKEVDETHRYSMSRIYGLANEVFGENETPESCASCLIRKVNQLKAWLKQEEDKELVLSPTNLESVDLVEKASKPKRKRKEA